jgi:hypothetical protein
MRGPEKSEGFPGFSPGNSPVPGRCKGISQGRNERAFPAKEDLSEALSFAPRRREVMKGRKTVILAATMCFLAFNSVTADEVVITFEDLPIQFPGYLLDGYAGLRWDNFAAQPGGFGPCWIWGSEPSRSDYSEPHSGNNYLIDGFGFKNVGFALPNPQTDTLSGAWFTASIHAAPQVRFNGYDSSGNLIEQSDWVQTTNTPTYLMANFGPAARITVEHNSYPTGVYYTMDDLTYSTPVPEPATLLLLAAGSLILRRKR